MNIDYYYSSIVGSFLIIRKKNKYHFTCLKNTFLLNGAVFFLDNS